uniref:Transmembrane protein n=1 Tax=Glossina austeni TaxID=7395 RepID=A0A1A9UV85_GLOAU
MHTSKKLYDTRYQLKFLHPIESVLHAPCGRLQPQLYGINFRPKNRLSRQAHTNQTERPITNAILIVTLPLALSLLLVNMLPRMYEYLPTSEGQKSTKFIQTINPKSKKKQNQ